MYKAGNCAYVHNVFYAAQILQDSLKAIKATSQTMGAACRRPAATNYRTFGPLP